MVIHAATDNDVHPPRFGGTQRTFGLVRGLARGHDVRLLCVVPNRTTGAREQVVDGVTLVRRKAWYTSLAWRLERLHLAPLSVAYGWHTAAARGLLAALPGTPDALCADLPLSGLLAASAAPLKVYTSHNVEYDHFTTTGAHVLGAGGWRQRVRAAEARAVERADLTVVCSDEDAARMRALYGADPARLHVAPNGYDETAVRPPSATERRAARGRLGFADDDYVGLFVGSDAPHNREALGFLVDQVGPALADAGVRLLIAGTVTRGAAIAPAPWLTVVPELADLAPVLHAADAGLNPVVHGGGSNVKLPTYLAAGLAVVTTGFGARGFPTLRPWLTLAERDRTAEALRARPAGWHARGESLPAAVAEFAWGTIGARLGDALAARAGDRAPDRDRKGVRA